MGNPIEFTITVEDESYRRRVEKQVRGLLILRQYDAYVDTINLPDDTLELTVDVSSPDDATTIKQKLAEIDHVQDVN